MPFPILPMKYQTSKQNMPNYPYSTKACNNIAGTLQHCKLQYNIAEILQRYTIVVFPQGRFNNIAEIQKCI